MEWLLIFLAFDLIFGILITLWIMRQVKDWNSKRQKEIEQLFSAAKLTGKQYSRDDTAHLPPPVQRYLIKSIKEGTPYVARAQLKQTGQMRFNNRWISVEADQYYTVEPANFIWLAKMKIGPVWIAARDRYQSGKGNMLIKILSAVPLFNSLGPEIDHASLLRYLSELPWLPTAMLSDNITWTEHDDRAAEATITNGGVSASGVFHFNRDDEITEFTSPGRFRTDTGKNTPWSGTFSNYQTLDGVRIPLEGKAIWNEAGGNFEYFHVKIERAEFNVPNLSPSAQTENP